MRFRQQIGGEKAINSYCHFLALHGGRLAAEILGTTVMDEDGSLTANMVRLNASQGLPFNGKLADAIPGQHTTSLAHHAVASR